LARLDGKVAIISGAGSGLGAETARLFTREGAKVVLTDLNKAAVHLLAKELGEAHVALEHDVTNETRWKEIFATTLETFSKVDILVNSAGVGTDTNIEECTLDEFRFVNAVNNEGTFLGCKYAVGAMKTTGGGSIVNISSVSGLIGVHNQVAYNASKGAVRLLTKSVALHCAHQKYNIRCNSVHPSYTETPMVQQIVDRASDKERAIKRLNLAAPLGRMGKPHEIAAAILFLASDESSFITGVELPVDGGLTAM